MAPTAPLPRLVVVTGPPASGKTTVARAVADALAWPLYTKDAFKELLFDTVGIGDLEWSSRLGNAAMELLNLVMRTELDAGRSIVVEANFRWIVTLPPARVVQVFCSDAREALLARYRARDRHPGHLDDERPLADLDDYAPLTLDGELIEFSVGGGRSIDDVVAAVRAALV